MHPSSIFTPSSFIRTLLVVVVAMVCRPVPAATSTVTAAGFSLVTSRHLRAASRLSLRLGLLPLPPHLPPLLPRLPPLFRSCLIRSSPSLSAVSYAVSPLALGTIHLEGSLTICSSRRCSTIHFALQYSLSPSPPLAPTRCSLASAVGRSMLASFSTCRSLLRWR